MWKEKLEKQKKDKEGELSIHEIAKYGTLQELRKAIAKDPQKILFIKDDSGRIPLHYTAMHGKTQECLFLIAKGTSPNLVDADEMSPLLLAAKQGHLETCRVLLDCSARITARDIECRTALHHAVRGRFYDLSLFLLKKGVDINAEERKGGLTALHIACELGDLELVDLLISRGANIHAPISSIKDDEDIKEETKLKELSDNGFGIKKDEESIEEYEKRKLFLSLPSPHMSGFQPIHLSIYYNHPDLLKLLIIRGCDVNSLGGLSDHTPLHLACMRNNLECVRILLKNNADINLMGIHTNGNTPLHLAAQYNNVEILLTLLSNHKCDPNLLGKFSTNGSALHVAARYNNIDIINELLAKSIKYKEEKDTTLLLTDENIEEEIRKNDSNPNDIIHNEKNIISIIRKNKNKKRKEIDINILDNKGRTALHIGCIYGNYELVWKMLELRDDILFDLKSFEGKTASQYIEQVAFRDKFDDLLYEKRREAEFNKNMFKKNERLKESNEKKLMEYEEFIERERLRIIHVLNEREKKFSSLLVALSDGTGEVSLLKELRLKYPNEDINTDLSPYLSHCPYPEIYHSINKTIINTNENSLVENNNKKEVTFATNSLLRACYHGFFSLVEALLYWPNIDLNYQDKEGNTPLHISAMMQYQDITHLLLRKGALNGIINKYKKVPANYAINQNFKEILRNPHLLYKIHNENESNLLNSSSTSSLQLSSSSYSSMPCRESYQIKIAENFSKLNEISNDLKETRSGINLRQFKQEEELVKSSDKFIFNPVSNNLNNNKNFNSSTSSLPTKSTLHSSSLPTLPFNNNTNVEGINSISIVSNNKTIDGNCYSIHNSEHLIEDITIGLKEFGPIPISFGGITKDFFSLIDDEIENDSDDEKEVDKIDGNNEKIRNKNFIFNEQNFNKLNNSNFINIFLLQSTYTPTLFDSTKEWMEVKDILWAMGRNIKDLLKNSQYIRHEGSNNNKHFSYNLIESNSLINHPHNNLIENSLNLSNNEIDSNQNNLQGSEINENEEDDEIVIDYNLPSTLPPELSDLQPYDIKVFLILYNLSKLMDNLQEIYTSNKIIDKNYIIKNKLNKNIKNFWINNNKYFFKYILNINIDKIFNYYINSLKFFNKKKINKDLNKSEKKINNKSINNSEKNENYQEFLFFNNKLSIDSIVEQAETINEVKLNEKLNNIGDLSSFIPTLDCEKKENTEKIEEIKKETSPITGILSEDDINKLELTGELILFILPQINKKNLPLFYYPATNSTASPVLIPSNIYYNDLPKLFLYSNYIYKFLINFLSIYPLEDYFDTLYQSNDNKEISLMEQFDLNFNFNDEKLTDDELNNRKLASSLNQNINHDPFNFYSSVSKNYYENENENTEINNENNNEYNNHKFVYNNKKKRLFYYFNQILDLYEKNFIDFSTLSNLLKLINASDLRYFNYSEIYSNGGRFSHLKDVLEKPLKQAGIISNNNLSENNFNDPLLNKWSSFFLNPPRYMRITIDAIYEITQPLIASSSKSFPDLYIKGKMIAYWGRILIENSILHEKYFSNRNQEIEKIINYYNSKEKEVEKQYLSNIEKQKKLLFNDNNSLSTPQLSPIKNNTQSSQEPIVSSPKPSLPLGSSFNSTASSLILPTSSSIGTYDSSQDPIVSYTPLQLWLGELKLLPYEKFFLHHGFREIEDFIGLSEQDCHNFFSFLKIGDLRRIIRKTKNLSDYEVNLFKNKFKFTEK